MFERGFVEVFLGLLAEGAAVDEEKNTAEAFGLQEAVHQADDGARLARAGSHRQQAVGLTGGEGAFDGLDGAFLIVAQVQVGETFLLQFRFGGGFAAG